MTSLRRLLLIAVIFLSLAICLAAPVWAAEGGEPNPAEAPIGTIFRWINFATVLGVLIYAARKWIAPALQARAAGISQAITEAAAAKAEAERQLRNAEGKLRGLEKELAAFRAAARRESVAEAERIRAATRQETDKIAQAAQAEIEAAERAARMEWKARAGRAAVERADALLRKQITAATQASLFRFFVDNLSGSVN